MGHSFHLGLDRRCAVVAFAAIAIFSRADFSSGDSQNLAHIRDGVDNLQGGLVDLEYIKVSIGSDRNNTVLSRLSDIVSGIHSVHVSVSNIYSRVDGLKNSFDTFSSKFSFNSSGRLLVSNTSAENKLDQMNSWLSTINTTLNNLTNNLCYDPVFSSTFNSNMVALLTSYVGYSWPVQRVNSTSHEAIIEELISNGDWATLVNKYGLWHGFLFPYLSSVDVNSLPTSMVTGINTEFQFIWGSSPLSRVWNNAHHLSGPYYYQYGVRPLVDDFELYTNQILRSVATITQALTNSSDPAFITTTTSESGKRHGFASGLVSMVGDLATSSYSSGMVDTNVSSVATNPIVNLEDSGYASQFSLIRQNADNVDGISRLSGILENNFSVFDDVLENSSSEDSYTFDFGTFSFFGVSKSVVFTFTQAPPIWYRAVNWFFFVIRMICILSTIGLIYRYVTHETLK